MTDSSKTKKSKLTLNSLKKRFFDLRRKISSNYLCIEFGYDYVQIAEAYYAKGKVNFKKIIRKDIPNEEFEKGVPSNSDAISELILNLLEEEKIFIRRTAIVLSPDSFFTRLIDIPNSIKERSIHKYLTDPSSSIQIPITIANTDFNIYNTSQLSKDKESNTYFFVASPKIVIDNLLKICEKTNLDLHYVEVGFDSLSRLINFDETFENNDEDGYLIMLELLPNCTYLTLFDRSSPIFISRLTSIRQYPRKIGEIAENQDSKYLSISKLDLKVLVKEIKDSLNNFFENKKKNNNFKIALTGINSLHPDISKTLSEYIKLPVYQFLPKSNLLIGDISYVSEGFYDINFSRLFGLGIGLLNYRKGKKNKSLTDFSLVNFHKTEKNDFLVKNKVFDNKQNLLFKNEKKEKKVLPETFKKSDVSINSTNLSGSENNDLKKGSNLQKPLTKSEIKNTNKFNSKESQKSKENSDKENNQTKNFKMDTNFLDID